MVCLQQLVRRQECLAAKTVFIFVGMEDTECGEVGQVFWVTMEWESHPTVVLRLLRCSLGPLDP